MKKVKHIIGCTLLFLLLLVASASAAQTGSVKEKLPVSGMKFSLYKVGRYVQIAGHEYELEEPFASYNVDLTDSSAPYLLAEYIERDHVKPDYTGKTDSNGEIYFGNLELAAYLMVGEPLHSGKTVYTPYPVLFSIPQMENDEIIYDITIYNKHERANLGKPPYRDVKVQKVWLDSGNEQSRPESITVQLLKDDELDPDMNDSEVVLNKSNNWTYVWKQLDNRYEWKVLEKEVPDGYKLSVEESTKDSPDDQNLEIVSIVLKNSKPGNPPDETKHNSPPPIAQTGQLWWPVGILAAAGLFFILIGLLLLGRKERN